MVSGATVSGAVVSGAIVSGVIVSRTTVGGAMVSAATVSVAAERAAHVEQALEQRMCCRPTLPSYHPYTLQALEQLMFSEPGLHTLVLMDLRMNVMDGFSAAMAIKKMGMDVPIIAVTADGRSALLRR